LIRWPDWWNWEIELTPHVEKRMIQRSFNEIDLRKMLSHASGFSPDSEHGRYVIGCKRSKADWEVIVESDFEEHLIVVITAYPTGE
jgi:hypothetical protein